MFFLAALVKSNVEAILAVFNNLLTKNQSPSCETKQAHTGTRFHEIY